MADPESDPKSEAEPEAGSEAESEAESDAVRAFMAERRASVLDRAITALTTCPTADLRAECHRLAGTLGSYGLADAARAVRTLHDALPGEREGEADRLRADTLAILGGLHDGGQGESG